MGGRGRAFAQAAYHNFGPVQLEDQLTVVDAVLAQYPQLDPKRLGWWGWSWGGTFTLYAMTHSDRFRAGVCCGSGYRLAQLRLHLHRALHERARRFPSGLQGLLRGQLGGTISRAVCCWSHGTGDDNVHIENTVQFVQKLIEAGFPTTCRSIRGKTHSISGPDARTHLYNRILAQFRAVPHAAGEAAMSRPTPRSAQTCVIGEGSRSASELEGIETGIDAEAALSGLPASLRLIATARGGGKFVLLAFGAVGALQAADKEHGDAYRNQDRQNARIRLRTSAPDYSYRLHQFKQLPERGIDLQPSFKWDPIPV